MRKIKIVADSSANMLRLKQVAFAAAPLKVITDFREFADDDTLNTKEMVATAAIIISILIGFKNLSFRHTSHVTLN